MQGCPPHPDRPVLSFLHKAKSARLSSALQPPIVIDQSHRRAASKCCRTDVSIAIPHPIIIATAACSVAAIRSCGTFALTGRWIASRPNPARSR